MLFFLYTEVNEIQKTALFSYIQNMNMQNIPSQ